MSAEVAGPPADWYHHARDLFTPYDFTSVDEFSCALSRGAPENPLFLLNHWLGPLPSEDLAAEANALSVPGARASACAAGRAPTLVAVDHYEIGALFEVVDTLNGL